MYIQKNNNNIITYLKYVQSIQSTYLFYRTGKDKIKKTDPSSSRGIPCVRTDRVKKKKKKKKDASVGTPERNLC